MEDDVLGEHLRDRIDVAGLDGLAEAPVHAARLDLLPRGRLDGTCAARRSDTRFAPEARMA